MEEKKKGMGRRTFLKSAVAAAVASALPAGLQAGESFRGSSLQVWSCGGLAEAFGVANGLYEKQTGVKIAYTGAFAAALGKSLLGGAVTDVFGGRVLKLAKKLRAKDKMVYFKPLCFTEYVMITPKGNPSGIKTIEDLGRPGVPVILPLGASPPGGDACLAIVKKAGIEKAVFKNLVEKQTCVIKMMPEIIEGKGHVSIVERRLTTMKGFEDRIEIIPIPESLFPPGPLTFTIGVMKHAKDRALADNYVEFICSEESQAIFGSKGFIPAISPRGQALVQKLGVTDV